MPAPLAPIFSALGTIYAIDVATLGANKTLAINAAGTAWEMRDLASASNITSGTLAVARGGTGVGSFGGTNRLLFTTATDTLSSIATANSSILATNGSGVPAWTTTLPAVNGAAVTSLTAANVTGSHTLSDGVLSTNVALLGTANSFSQDQTVTGLVVSRNSDNHITLNRSGVDSWSFFIGNAGQLLFRDITSNTVPLCLLNGALLGINTTSPGYHLHIRDDAIADDFARFECVGTAGVLSIAFAHSRDSGANLALNDPIGTYRFIARANGNWLDVGGLRGVYTGNGTTQTSDLVFLVSNAGAPVEKARLSGAGVFTVPSGITAGNSTFSVFGVAAVARASAVTQTYSTTTRTHSNPTAVSVTNNTGGTITTTLAAITAGASYAQGDMTATKNALASLADQHNKLVADLANAKQLLNAIIDDLQLYGLEQ